MPRAAKRFPRYLVPRLREALRDTPAVLIHGARHGRRLRTPGGRCCREFYHFRDRDDFEVDLVLVQGRTIAGVEVKAAATVGDADFRGLRKTAGRNPIGVCRGRGLIKSDASVGGSRKFARYLPFWA